ncbi:MAG: hypothetical protein ACRCXZ_06145 [Patescibacteria group bacterium]
MKLNYKSHKYLKYFILVFFLILFVIGLVNPSNYFSFKEISTNNSSADNSKTQQNPEVVDEDKNGFDVIFYSNFSNIEFEEKGFEKNNLLFFTTKECSECEILENNILDHMNKQKSPTSIFKVDMEDHKDLLEKYKIEKQGTIVKIKYSDQSELKKAIPGSNTYPQNLSELIQFAEQ